MEYRALGNTGRNVSLLGFGGFHLLEIPAKEAGKLLNAYLDAGGNYVETAAGYGNGESERKIGQSIAHRRGDYVLVSKTGKRDAAGAAEQIDLSLKNLRTDHLDGILMHAVGAVEELDQILAPGGAYQAAEAAQKAGKVGFIGISMHGWAGTLIEALRRGRFAAVMSTINYYDRCNFPEIEGALLPLAQEKGAGVILMKPVADGYLYRSAAPAFRYAFSRPVSVVVAGINNEKMLKDDLAYVENYAKMTEAEERALLMDAPELGNYVCRQCGKCACPQGVNIQEVFACEGLYDRQMARGVVGDTAEYALMERLRFWFGQQALGRARYAKIPGGIGACTGCGSCLAQCPYRIDIPEKLRMADYKLAGRDIY
ncbi:MAG: aldo/keto reductase [Clostridia bacterium]|nr:aldo/keto reductase [Clostridia bacterium]